MLHAHPLVARQLEQGQEEPDRLATRATAEDLLQRERTRSRTLQAIDDVVLMQADRRVVVLDLVVAKAGHVHRLHDALERTEEVKDVGILEFDRIVGALRLGARAHATDGVALGEVATQPVERVRRGAEPLVRHELLNELETGIGRVKTL